MADITFTITFDDQGSPILKKIQQEAGATGATVAAAATKSSESLSNVASAATLAAREIGTIATGVKEILAVIGAGLLVEKIIAYADTWQLLDGRLKLVTTSTQNLIQTQDQLFALAQNTRQSFEGTVDLYTRMARATQSLGINQGTLLSVTETLNKAIIVSGASSEEARLGVIQLGQAFALGTLQGQDLRSVMEQMPRVGQAIAAGMGITIGQLRKLGEEGKLTTQQVIEALQKEGQTINQEFSQMPVTVGQAWTVLENSTLRAVGRLNEATGFTATLAAGMVTLAHSIDQATTSQHNLNEEQAKQKSGGFFNQVGQVAATGGSALVSGTIEGTKQLASTILNLNRTAADGIIILTNLFTVPLQPAIAYGIALAKGENAEKAFAQAGADAAAEIAGAGQDIINTWSSAAAATAAVAAATAQLPPLLQQYIQSAKDAAAAQEALTKAQEDGKAQLQNDITTQAIKLAVLEDAKAKNLSLADALSRMATEQAAAKSGDLAGAEALAHLTKAVQDILDPWKASEEAAKKAAEAAKQLAEAQAKAAAETQAELALYQQVNAGVLTLAQAQEKLMISKLAEKVGSEDLAKQYTEEKQKAEDLAKADDLIAKKSEELHNKLNEEAKAGLDAVKTIEAKTAADQEEAQIIEQGIASGRKYDDVMRDIAITQAEAALSAKGVSNNVHALAVASVDAADKLTKDKEALKALHDEALLSTKDIETVITGILQGTQSLPNILESLGQAMGVRLIKGILFGKGQNEGAILENFNGLLGIGAQGIFGSQGFSLGQLLGFSAAQGIAGQSNVLQEAWHTAIDASQVVWKTAGNSAGTSFMTSLKDTVTNLLSGNFGGALTSFQGSGISGGIAGGLAGNFAGNLFSGLLHLNGSQEAQIGGQVGSTIGSIIGFAIGGPIGSFLGSFGGDLLGSIFGGLFAHIPTKGTQIRKSVIDYLTEIKVSFASELNSKNYFFEETKALAKQLFGGDFLAASKQILTEKAGPELAKQLQALGTILTADQAAKLGKSVEQTGTIFGNLLIANLGIDQIPDAIKEIVQKANINFAGLTDKLTEVFKAGAISTDFYKTTLQGAVGIFFGDLPAAINVSSLAMQAFSAEGIFDLGKFQQKLKATTDIFDLISQQFRNALLNSKDGEEAAKLFGEGLQKGLNDLAKEAFITDFIKNRLFAGIDLSNGLDSSEIALLTERARQARVELDAIGTAFDGAASSAQGLVDQITQLNQQILALSRQRIQIQVDLASQLGQIGALTPLQVAQAKDAALRPEFNALVNPPLSAIGTRSGLQGLSDAQLARALDLAAQLSSLAIERYNAEAAAIQKNLQSNISAIQQEFAAKREGIQASITALQRQKQQEQEIFQSRLSDLRTQLQSAQEMQRIAASLTNTIRSLVIGQASPLTGTEQLAFLQRQAGDLRARLVGATGADRGALIQELSGILSQQAGLLDHLSPGGIAQFESIVRELETLRNQAAAEGAKAGDIQQQILNTETAQKIALASLDAQIATQQQLLSALSQQEQSAIAAAQAGIESQLTALRASTAAELQAHAATRDALLQEQIRRLEAQRQVLMDQLTAQVGAEQAANLLSDQAGGQIVELAQANQTLLDIRGLLATFLTNVTPLASGGEGFTHGNHLVMLHPNEFFSIRPNGAPAAGNSNINVQISVPLAPALTVNYQGTGSPQQDGARLGRAQYQILLYEIEHGELGQAIAERVKRSM